MLVKKIIKIIRINGPFAILKKGIEKVKRSYFQYLMNKNKLEKAINIGKNLMKEYPEKDYYYLMLAECYRNNNEITKSNDLIEKSMKFKFSLNDRIAEIEREIGAKDITSKYIKVGGKQNGGCIEHKSNDYHNSNQFLTKISIGSGRRMEKLFYLNVYVHFPLLKAITPMFVNFIELNSIDVSLLTMRKIDGVKPHISNRIIKQIICINNKITSIKYKEVSEFLSIPNNDRCYMDNGRLPDNPLVALRCFELTHKESMNNKIFNAIFKTINERNYSSKSFKLIKRLESIIIDKRLYKEINVNEHYSLQQGDFWVHNMLIENKSEKLYILDWGHLKVGPSGTDIAGFFGLLNQPFSFIKETFLNDDNACKQLASIEKVFFVYALIVVWFIHFTREEFENGLHLYVQPAIKHVETMLANKQEAIVI